jgi:hypothetical protein
VSGSLRRWPLNRLQGVQFDAVRCDSELAEFEELLRRRGELRERSDILPFFRQRPHLATLLGSYNRNLTSYDRLAFELTLIDEFVADVVIGDPMGQAICLVEFEDARPASIFRQTARRATEWTPRFDHGASQIIDWFWKLDDLRGTSTLARLFGSRSIDATGLLVIGRDSGVTAADRPRLVYRRDKVRVGRRRLYCCTFDELARDLRERLDAFRLVAGLV